MNTEIIKNKDSIMEIGKILRKARKKMGLTKKNVAENLCLKLSVIKNIEENNVINDISFTFLKGYIRSYAKLVHVSEEEIFPINTIIDSTPIRSLKIASSNHIFFLEKLQKYKNWIIFIFFLVIIVILFIFFTYYKNSL